MTTTASPDKKVTENGVIANLAHRAAGPTQLDIGQVFLLPNGQVVDTLESELLRADRPRRRRGSVDVYDVDSLLRLVTDLGAEHGAVRIYGAPGAMQFVAVLNDDDGQAGWADHRIVLQVRRTPEWQRWRDHQGLGDQASFAEHIERCRADIVAPPAADMLEIAQSFQATIDASFRGGARLKDGARQIGYVESVNATAGQEGHLVVPDAMSLRLRLFEGGGLAEIEAPIRFRIRSGALSIGYELHGVEEAERVQFDAMRAIIEAEAGVPVVLGSRPCA